MINGDYNMENIKNLVFRFRNAIDCAKENGETDSMRFFEKFPTGCCGETSDFLGHFLLEHGIQTSYICRSCPPQNEEENSQHHAWLLFKDNIIIDITGDQFKDEKNFLNYNLPIYIGLTDDFHNLFTYEDIKRKSVFLNELNTINDYMFFDVYNKITKYL